ncbi:MAG: hypothetical protein COA67_05140 [Lutibacter sp.]|nr:MAG: hypothetical protein COA67_05140 [Lutibacter sp.]
MSFVYSQANSTIVWEESRKLTWNDFEGKTDSINFGKAKTSYSIKILPEQVTVDENDNIQGVENMTVQAEFDKKQSWSLAKFDTVVLSHEQLHFDIAELYARKIRRQFYKNILAKRKTYERFWGDYKVLWDECSTFQNKLDADTNHGRNKEQNKIWRQLVFDELKKSESFK